MCCVEGCVGITSSSECRVGRRTQSKVCRTRRIFASFFFLKDATAEAQTKHLAATAAEHRMELVSI